jgi:hypothetical protein
MHNVITSLNHNLFTETVTNCNNANKKLACKKMNHWKLFLSSSIGKCWALTWICCGMLAWPVCLLTSTLSANLQMLLLIRGIASGCACVPATVSVLDWCRARWQGGLSPLLKHNMAWNWLTHCITKNFYVDNDDQENGWQGNVYTTACLTWWWCMRRQVICINAYQFTTTGFMAYIL